MFVLSNFIIALAKVLDILLWFMYWMLLIRVLISWVNPDPYNPIVQFLMRMTEPILRPIRSRMPPTMMFDLSPIVAFLGILFLQYFLVRSLYDWAFQLRQ